MVLKAFDWLSALLFVLGQKVREAKKVLSFNLPFESFLMLGSQIILFPSGFEQASAAERHVVNTWLQAGS